MKVCGRCKIEKPYSAFSKHARLGYQSYCKECNKAHKTEWLVQNRDKVRWNQLWARYRMRKEEWFARLEAQGGVCKICYTREPEVVDHDHKCCSGKTSCGACTRGLLCNRCNVMLGVIEYNELLERILAYTNGVLE